MEEEHADDVVARLVHAAKVHDGVDTSGERTVEPSTTLRNEFGGALGHVSFTFGSLDVAEMPFRSGLGHQLEAENTIFGQEHVLLENVHSLDTLRTQLLGERVVTVEILFEGTTHDSTESVCGESSGQHTDITKRTLQRLVKNVTDLVLKVLRGDQGVDQVLPPLTQHGVNLTAASTKVLVVVEGLPQGEKGLVTGFSTGVEQDTDFGVENAAKGVEEPSVGVDLLAVLLFQAEHHLHRRQSRRAIVNGANELLIGRNRQLGGVLELEEISTQFSKQSRLNLQCERRSPFRQRRAS